MHRGERFYHPLRFGCRPQRSWYYPNRRAKIKSIYNNKNYEPKMDLFSGLTEVISCGKGIKTLRRKG